MPAGTRRADRELTEFRQRARVVRNESFGYHLGAADRNAAPVESIEELPTTPRSSSEKSGSKPDRTQRRDRLLRSAERDAVPPLPGRRRRPACRRSNLLIATSQNNLAINKAVEQTAAHSSLPMR